jgi:uncharacterized damage-inducible protein DinB
MSEDQGFVFGKALIAECERRLFDESVPRLKKCLAALNEDEIWLRLNSETVSVGNLVLHLCGNVRQWVISALGNAPDVRNRDKEFSETGPFSAAELTQKLDTAMAEVKTVLRNLDAASLLEIRSVQGFRESGLSILVHVVEHFSYHTGQITYFVKSRKAMDMQYYRDKNLNKTAR